MERISRESSARGAIGMREKCGVFDTSGLVYRVLIENIDLAFKAWKTKPWAKDMTLDTFCEYILPYRANKEPVERWRAACEVDAKSIVALMKDPQDPKEAAGLVQKDSKHHIGFSEVTLSWSR